MSDLISRQAALTGYQKVCYGIKCIECPLRLKVGERLSDCRLEAFIRELPSAQPEQRWIPCSKRLPEDLEEVNVTWVNHDPAPYYNFIKDKPFTATAVYYKEKWYWYSSTCVDVLAEYDRNTNEEIDDGIEITAWMPLPKPWKEE